MFKIIKLGPKIVFIAAYVVLNFWIIRLDCNRVLVPQPVTERSSESTKELQDSIGRSLDRARHINPANCGRVPKFDWSGFGGAYCDDGKTTSTESFRQDKDIQVGQFPSVAYIKLRNNQYFKDCIGYIVDVDTVISGYNCLFNHDAAVVAVGAKFMAAYPQTGFDKNISQVRYAYGYCRVRLKHTARDVVLGLRDLVVFKLTDPWVYTDYVQPACLAIDNPVKSDASCFKIRSMNLKYEFYPNYLPVKRMDHCITVLSQQALNSLTCYSSVWVARLNKFIIHDGSPVYCIDRCNGTTKQWVVGSHLLSGLLGKNESTQANKTFSEQHMLADLYKIREELTFALDNCRQM